jgi:hypothetical protein
MSQEIVCPKGHAGDGYRLVKDGIRPGRDGLVQTYRCSAADGATHWFRAPLSDPTAGPTARPAGQVRCPTSGHRDGKVQSRGVRETRSGTWRRYVCRRPNGETHSFQLMLSEADGVAVAPRLPPPDCPEHPGSRVIRWGTYGLRSQRQRYLCRPAEGKPHQFTPPLSREAVEPGEACDTCDELLSPHHGPVTAARHTPWTLVGVAKALNDLSLGESYANVSLALRAQRDAAMEHLSSAHGVETSANSAAPVATSSASYSQRQRKNAWRVAADLVEQYSPPLYAAVEEELLARTQALRDANDAALAAAPNGTLSTPIVYVLDELPIWTEGAPGKNKRPSWNVLAVAEVLWRPPSSPHGLPERETRLRLARAFPRNNADAWRLVLEELQVRPDFVVADNGSGLQGALRAHYGTSVANVPSMWHIQKNLRETLLELPNTTFRKGKETVLLDPLRKHLGRLSRDEIIGGTATDVAHWWDELESIVAGLPAPVPTIVAQRKMHEPRLVAALPLLNANPHVPASNAAIESRIRVALKPFLSNRAHMFGNQERTNRLLNLIMCREAGMFNDLSQLALRIRQLNESNGGWAPEPRQILDRQPPSLLSTGKRYQSLKSYSVVSRLAQDKGITTKAQAAAAITPTWGTAKKSPERVASLSIRDWAKKLGLPVNPTGPIKDAVKGAYAASQNGASDDEARALYEQLESARLATKVAVRKERWPAGTAAQRTAELAPVREWAASQGIDVPINGRIPVAVLDAYKKAQDGEAVTWRPSKKPGKKKP